MSYQEEMFYAKWKTTQSNDDLMKIVRELEPTIRQAVQKWNSGSMSDAQLNIKAKLLTIEAIKSWDKSRGVKLSTYVTNYLKKLSRDVYKSNIIYLPEQQVLDYQTLSKVKSELESELNSPATLGDISSRLGWGEKKILNLEKNFKSDYNDSILNTKNYFNVSHVEEDDLLYAYRNLTDEEQNLFTMKTGWPTGKKAMGIVEIAKNRGVSVGYLSKKYKEIGEKIKKILRV